VSQNRLELDGLTELRAALRHLPAQLTAEADAIIRASADQAKREIQAAYPEGPTGNLKRGVTVQHNASKFFTSAIVRSRAKHAHLFEFGTRRRTSRRGNRGAMPVAPEGQRMIPIAIRIRRQMVTALIDLVRRAGFEVAA
jgi:bacteriophage HK97-gp10 putative tail-component